MNRLDYLVLFASVLAIAVYGIVRTRGRRNLHDYLRGKKRSPWFFIGLSVMATQASAVTFLSTPGQGYASGLGFVQNYFAMPVALIIIAAVFLPIYRRFNVYTAYEYLGQRFDKKTRLLAASLFVLQRGLAAGITIYAPAIVLSTVFGWSLSVTVVGSGLVVMAYTVAGGSDAVTHTQKYQITVIFIGMIAAFWILMSKIPCSFPDALTLAGQFGKTNAVSFKPDLKERYTFWTGMLGGVFLMLSYFGTDQSQVQRYISGDDLRESRLGLMFNALFKIPMQFGILLLGVMLFVFYQFHPQPIAFNQTAWEKATLKVASVAPAPTRPAEPPTSTTSGQAAAASPQFELQMGQAGFQSWDQQKRDLLGQWVSARRSGNEAEAQKAMNDAKIAADHTKDMREKVVKIAKTADASFQNSNDADYVFITFILQNLPHGLIGLLVACFFFATLSAKAAELNALASTTMVDYYRYIIRPPAKVSAEPEGFPVLLPGAAPVPPRTEAEVTDRHYVIMSKVFTAAWGLVAIAFALFLHVAENLIQASNIIGSLFSGCVLGLFLLAFFFKWVNGTAAFCGALVAQAMVIVMFFTLNIAYLWYNLIGSLGCILFAVVLQAFLRTPAPPPQASTVEAIDNRSPT